MKEKTIPKILLVDYGGWDSLMSVPYLFNQAGCTVDVFCCERSWATKSRYCDTIIFADDNPEEYIRQLKKHISSFAYDWIVLGDDSIARIVSKIDDEDFVRKIIPLSKFDTRYILGSKAGISLACSQYTILTPRYAIYDASLDSGVLAREVSFPLVLKLNESAGGAGVFLCANEADVHSVLARLSEDEKKDLVFQKFIDGENIAVEAMYKNGRCIAYSYAIVMKTTYNSFGVSSERRYVEYPDIEGELSQIGVSLGLHGFCSMTFIKNNEGHYLIEADLRPQAWFPLASIAGTDFAQGIRRFLSDDVSIMRPTLPEGKNEVFIRHFPRDILWCVENKNYSGLLKWGLNTDGRWRTVPWNDLGLLGTLLFRGGRYYARKLRRKIVKTMAHA